MAANDLTFNQISAVLNSVVRQATGQAAQVATDTSSFVTQAQTALKALMQSHFCELSISDVPVVRKTHYCRFVQEGNCFVRYDGNVAPCMGVLHNSVTYLWQQKRKIYHYSFGNASRQRLDEIWYSDSYSQFRQRVSEFTFSPCMYCGGCELREENREDCYGNEGPTCGACLWAEGIIRCP